MTTAPSAQKPIQSRRFNTPIQDKTFIKAIQTTREQTNKECIRIGEIIERRLADGFINNDNLRNELQPLSDIMDALEPLTKDSFQSPETALNAINHAFGETQENPTLQKLAATFAQEITNAKNHCTKAISETPKIRLAI